MDAALTLLREGIKSSISVKVAVLDDTELLRKIIEVSQIIQDAVARGNRVLFGGNGGSAADAQHLAAEFVSRFEFDRPGLPALSLSTDTSMLTAIGNDYGYEFIFRRQLEAQARVGDVFVGITTSGRSKNILAALSVCQSLGVTSVVMCGTGGALEGLADHVIRVPSNSTPRIQECHILIGHMICAYVETGIFGHLKK
jgi:D-sedoheptulose 7-phosphate isomerase